MISTDKVKFLKEVKKILDSGGVKFWLDCGTLLGVIRENNIIEYDHDIDLSIRDEDKQMVENVRGELRKIGDVKDARQTPEFVSSTGIHREDFKIDLYYWKKIGDKRVSIFTDKCVNVFPDTYISDTDIIEFKGEKFEIPNNAEQYLEDRYGKNWRIPDKNWDEQKQQSKQSIKKYNKYFL